jgi:enoyl-CoA hydratase/carnithine racemase
MARADIKERLIGESKTKERMFTGDLILADQALHLGLVDHVVPKGEGLAYAKKLAEKINRFSFPALLESKKQSMKVFKRLYRKDSAGSASISNRFSKLKISKKASKRF